MTYKHLRLISLILIVFCNQKTISQHSYKEIVALSSKIDFSEKKIDSILSTVKIKDAKYAQIAHNFSFFHNKKTKNYNLAIKYGKIEVSILDSLKLVNKKHTNALYNIGKFYLKKKQYQQAIIYFTKAINSNNYPKRVAQSYCEIGNCYDKKGEYYKSIDFFLKGIPLLEKYGSKRSVLVQCVRLSNCCYKINTQKSTDLGLFYLKKGDSLIKNNKDIKFRSKTKNFLFTALANLYSNSFKKKINKAKNYYLRVLNNALIKKDSGSIANTYMNLGELYLDTRNDSCVYFLNKSIKYDLTEKVYLNETYRNLATFYKRKFNYNKALSHIEKAIFYNFEDVKNRQINSLTINQILNTYNKRSVLLSLKTKTEILLQLYNSTQEKEYLQKSIDNVQLTNKIVNILISYSTEANTKYLWRKEISETFNLGIYTAYLLNDSKLMFELMEKNKAFLLALNINENIKLTNLPDEVSIKNNVFKKDIFQLESETNTYKASKKKDSLFDLKVSYQNFKDSIQKIYPQFSNQNKDIQQISFNQVKSNLNKNDIKLYYTLNTSNVDSNKQSMLGLLIAKNKDIRFKIKNIDSVLLGITEYKKLISKPITQKQELARFKKVSYSLYNQLFPNKETKEIIKNKNISIVTDVSLENIPFEAFNTSSTGLQYLVNDCNISYTYSSSFSEFNKNRDRKTNTDIAVFAPVNFKNTELSSLEKTEKEAAVISNLIGGDSFTNSNATKENFVRKTSNAKIIHLATHANASNNPSIQFFTNDLKLHELYTYKNNADLVVLSACETNIGELKQGEGVLNLARGFFHSGANAVVSSTWKINDASSSYIMKEFYSNLKNKESKSEALNNAKRTYLKNHSLSEQSPYYWASFVLIGDTSPVFTTNYLLYILPILLGLFIIFIFFQKKG
ncbi:CHAT domain-containing protein [Tenacibaculum sp. MAR_2010_89]|uniref:CHAT domain-containing protein n=1 Tax=Tenacibaculum sp. MAR_2010_89 TaxID=1250198 RepID=UPI00089A9F85|nr:CHAT domain-containing protein [Tenacibaculum sp. MAR_2010_89]SED63570.1 CHAT domain-containing protein [Tenacibaculum sp. MAR_2010_89]